MIVFHNAWQYYNDRFGITTLGFVERNPGQEPNPQQVAQLVDLAKQHGVRGVFSEPEYSPKILQSIAQGAGIQVVEDLYDDSIGTDPRVATYTAMLTYDTGSSIVRDVEMTQGDAVVVRDLFVRYEDFDALVDATLTVRYGEALGIVGPNGSGKSTLLKTVAGLLLPSAGELLVLGSQPRRLPPGTIAYVPQIEAVDWSFPATVWDVVAMGRFARMRFWEHFSARDREVVRTALDAVQMSDLATRHIANLSGGQQQRASSRGRSRKSRSCCCSTNRPPAWTPLRKKRSARSCAGSSPAACR